MTPTAYPLYWPLGMPRTVSPVKSQFKTSLAGALKNVKWSLEMFGKESKKLTESLVISSNVTLGQQIPKDAGVACWFTWDKQPLCIAVDRYEKVEDNLQAIHHILEARRTELRHGGLHIVKQTFTGFKALPGKSGRAWWDVLNVSRTAMEANIKNAYRELVQKYHPDKPTGDADKFREVQVAYEQYENSKLQPV